MLARALARFARWYRDDHMRVVDALVRWQYSDPITRGESLRIGLWLVRDGVMPWHGLPGFVWVRGGRPRSQ